MKEPESKTNPATEQKEKRKRMTLGNLIASAATHADKWHIALRGDKPLTAIQFLPYEAGGFAFASPHGPEYQAAALNQLKQKFTDLLLPALIKDDPKPFEELLEAMAQKRRTCSSSPQYAGLKKAALKQKPSKKEVGRRLRLALLSLSPDDQIEQRMVENAALEKSWQSMV